jgi:predicted NBD/HSP70 family sugar kinase
LLKVFTKVGEEHTVNVPIQRLSELNRLAVLRTIYDHETFTKMDVVREAHLSLPTINDILSALQEEGYVSPNGSGESRGGRPPALYRFNPAARYCIGVQIDSPTIALGLVDLGGHLHAIVEYPVTDSATSEYFQSILTHGIADLLTYQHVDRDKLVGIGMGIPGYFERDTGTWLGYLPLRSFSQLGLRDLLSNQFGVPVTIQHASNVYTLAELSKSPGLPRDDLLVISCAEGVKASVVVDGRILSGDHGNFGRVGHLNVVENGRPCYCGARGCLEMYASGRSLREEVRVKRPAWEGIAAVDDPALAYRVFRMAAEGDPVYRELVERAIPYMATAFASLINLTDIGHLVLSGAYAEGGSFLAEALQEHVARRVPRIPGLQLSIRSGSRLTNSDLVVSAAMPAIQAHLGTPLAGSAIV